MSLHAEAVVGGTIMLSLGAVAPGGDVFAWSLCGAVGGGLIAASMMNGDNWPKFIRWLVSTIAGAQLTPGIIEYWGFSETAAIAMGLAMMVAFASWGILRVLQTELPELAKRWLAKK